MQYFKLNLPNDYGSEADNESALYQAYGDDADEFRGYADASLMYEPIAAAASAAGLKYVSESDYGAIWKGTEEQFTACLAALPEWAKPYASVGR